MKIDKIENAWTVEITETVEATPENDFRAYNYKTYAFHSWEDVLTFISDKKDLI